MYVTYFKCNSVFKCILINIPFIQLLSVYAQNFNLNEYNSARRNKTFSDNFF